MEVSHTACKHWFGRNPRSPTAVVFCFCLISYRNFSICGNIIFSLLMYISYEVYIELVLPSIPWNPKSAVLGRIVQESFDMSKYHIVYSRAHQLEDFCSRGVCYLVWWLVNGSTNMDWVTAWHRHPCVATRVVPPTARIDRRFLLHFMI